MFLLSHISVVFQSTSVHSVCSPHLISLYIYIFYFLYFFFTLHSQGDIDMNATSTRLISLITIKGMEEVFGVQGGVAKV